MDKKKLLEEWAQSFTVAIAAAPDIDGHMVPGEDIAAYYNRLRKEVLAEYRDLAFCMPPAIGVTDTSLAKARYVEIHAYSVAIRNFLQSV